MTIICVVIKMLLKVLKKIREMQFFSLTQLVSELNIDKTMASHIIDQLKAMGYLQEEVLSMSCNGDCKKCVGCLRISSIRPTKTLTVTEKGNRVLKRNRVKTEITKS